MQRELRRLLRSGRIDRYGPFGAIIDGAQSLLPEGVGNLGNLNQPISSIVAVEDLRC